MARAPSGSRRSAAPLAGSGTAIRGRASPAPRKPADMENAPGVIKPPDTPFLADQLGRLEEQYRLARAIEGVAEHLLQRDPYDLSAYQYLKNRVRDFLQLLH